MHLKHLQKTLFASAFILLMLLTFSCGSNKMVAENTQLKKRVLDLEHRIYELTESPDHLLEGVLQDVNLLMILPTEENLNLGLDLIIGFESSYPQNKNLHRLEKKKNEINQILTSGSALHYGSPAVRNSSNSKDDAQSSNTMLQFSVEISKKDLGFVNVVLKVQNMSNESIANLWLKATMIDSKGQSYGITQDFFFNRLKPYDYSTETLSWEYVRVDEIAGIQLSQIRFSQNRKSRLLKEDECSTGQGNVKIFLDF